MQPGHGHEADHSRPYSLGLKIRGTVLHVFMVWYLVKHTDNIALL